MINDLSVPAGLIQGDMFKYAEDTEISDYILGSACSSNMQCVTNSIINWSQMIFSNIFRMQLSAFKEPLELSILIYLIKLRGINLTWLPCGRKERNYVLNFSIP